MKKFIVLVIGLIFSLPVLGQDASSQIPDEDIILKYSNYQETFGTSSFKQAGDDFEDALKKFASPKLNNNPAVVLSTYSAIYLKALLKNLDEPNNKINSNELEDYKTLYEHYKKLLNIKFYVYYTIKDTPKDVQLKDEAITKISSDIDSAVQNSVVGINNVVSDSNWVLKNVNYDGSSTSFNVPNKGIFGSSLTWTSLNPAIITINNYVASVSRPKGKNEVVKLNVIIEGKENSGIKLVKEVPITVQMTDLSSLNLANNRLTTYMNNVKISYEETSASFTIPENDIDGSTISWKLDGQEIPAGKVVISRAFEDKKFILEAIISKGDETPVTRSFSGLIKKIEQTSLIGEETIKKDLIDLKKSIPSLITTTSYSFVTSGENGSKIEWESSDNNVVKIDRHGYATINVPANGENAVTLTANVSSGGVTEKQGFTVHIKSKATISADDEESIKKDSFYLMATDNNGVVLSFLPIKGSNGSTIEWSSDKPTTLNVNNSTGEVKIVKPISENISVSLTATILKNKAQPQQKSFVTVIHKETEEEATLADESALINNNPFSTDVIIEENKSYNVPVIGAHGSKITWESDFSTLVDIDSTNGKITLRQPIDENKIIIVKAIISNGKAKPLEKKFSFDIQKSKISPYKGKIDKTKKFISFKFRSTDKTLRGEVQFTVSKTDRINFKTFVNEQIIGIDRTEVKGKSDSPSLYKGGYFTYVEKIGTAFETTVEVKGNTDTPTIFSFSINGVQLEPVVDANK